MIRHSVIALVTLFAACHHAGADPAGALPAPVAADTLRGTLVLTGSTPLTQLVLRPADGGRSVPVTGDSAMLRSVIGLEVWLTGKMGEKSFAVAALKVRATGGTPVFDGTIALYQGAVSIVTEDGVHHALKAAPAELAALAGRRAWVLTGTDGTVVSFGAIR